MKSSVWFMCFVSTTHVLGISRPPHRGNGKMKFYFWLVCFLTSLEFFVAGGLRLKELIVPPHVDVHEDVTLSCIFDLAGKRLYSVKWYKDEFEFYRFMPGNRPQTQVFPVTGVTLDESISGINIVTLTSLTYNSSGSYRCEVSTEGPNFDTVFANRNMSVMALPHADPAISGVQPTYSVGDSIVANCTAAFSNPAPTLTWYLNGNKVITPDFIKVDKFLVKETPMVTKEDLFSRSLILRFRAERRHFQGPRATLELRCRVNIGDLPPWETVIAPKLASALANQKLAQHLGKAAVSGPWQTWTLLAIVFYCVSIT